MKSMECTVTDGKKQIVVQPAAMTVFLQNKMVEAYDAKGSVYYLVFFKNEYLTTWKAESLRRRSFLEKACKYGVVYQSPHPFIREVLSSQTSYHKRSLSQLRGKFQGQHTTQETALMLTFFDAFVSKKELFKEIQSFYYQHRRSGQLFLGYRIIRLLQDFTPKHSWVKQMANDMEFSSFKDLYQRSAPELWEKDPIYMEKAHFYARKNSENTTRLLQFLKEEKRWAEAFSLMVDLISRYNAEAYYKELLQWLKLYYDKEEQLAVLEDLYDRAPSIKRLQEDLLEMYLTENKLENALILIKRHHLALEGKNEAALENMLATMDLHTGSIPLDELSTYIVPLYETQPQKAEKILQKCVHQLLSDRTIQDIMNWLAPVREKYQSSPTVKQMDKMKKLREDPDKQRELGEMLYEFNQLDQAIECFSWEMELNTTDPEPVRWLSKIYLDLGKEAESKAYQDLYRKMQKANA
ncbi:hypothetical protein [Salibacterium aidingense]|uniref:hypothetical protein n=1 Tax=Salibacterium aidingense TaxID=384933 RepID=UPI003BC31E0F